MQDDDATEPTATETPAPPLTRKEKREEAAAYGELAEKLSKGPTLTLPDPPFDTELREAVAEARRLEKTARPRQIRRLAQLLQQAAPISEIRDALNGRAPTQVEQREREAANEAWRTRLLAEGDVALAEFIDQHPAAERRRFRHLVRRASATPPDHRAKKAGTTLLREIRALSAAVKSDAEVAGGDDASADDDIATD
jgi:ribosome-associated protein